MICFDRNAIIGVLRRSPRQLVIRFDEQLSSGKVAISSLVIFELSFGIAKSRLKSENQQRLADFLSGPINILPFDAEDGREAGEIRAGLERLGTPIGAYDAFIAAQARRRDALLVTGNMREFSRVPGLRCEDWSV